MASLSCRRHFAYKVSSDSDIMPNLTVHLGTSGQRGPAALAPQYPFSTELRRIKESSLLFGSECVGCLVLRLIVPGFLEEVAR